jgi:nitroimidazol reductase NimA-like FMN-containing flavoprotein (pyridoxamine 5'-phosphate oxidase superfamily)
MSEAREVPQGPINRVRRRERAVEDEEWIRGFLREARYGVVATECGGQPFVNPLLFAYDEESHALYFHTSREGRICANIGGNARVCFCASEMGRLVAGAAACGMDVEYGSVVVFGRAEVLEDATEAARALRLLVEKYFPEMGSGAGRPAMTAEEVARPAVYRVRIEAWSGKRNAAEAEAR